MLQIGGAQSTVNLFKVHYFSLPFNHYLLSISSDRMILKRMAEKGLLNRHFFKPILIIFGIITPSIKRQIQSPVQTGMVSNFAPATCGHIWNVMMGRT